MNSTASTFKKPLKGEKPVRLYFRLPWLHCYSHTCNTQNSTFTTQGEDIECWRKRESYYITNFFKTKHRSTFIALTNFSLFIKASSMMLSSCSLKSSKSCTILLSFSGSRTMLVPCFWKEKKKRKRIKQALSERQNSEPKVTKTANQSKACHHY